MARPRSPALALLAALLLAGITSGQSAVGQRLWGAGQFVEYVIGNAPIVISSAHGGYLRPAEIPDRTYGVVVQDMKTQEMARALAREVVRRTGRQPHLIISHLHRLKLDPNRTIAEAAQGDPLAEQAYRDFHTFVDIAHQAVSDAWSTGLYVDVHGHSHPNDWTEFGYTLSSNQLALSDATLNSGGYAALSTLQFGPTLSASPFSEVLRGMTSLGGHMQASGFDSVPSPVYPSPGNNPYFTGGFNVREYGPKGGGSLDAVQIELPSSVRATSASRVDFAVKFAVALDDFLGEHYLIDAALDPLVTVTASQATVREAVGSGALLFTRSGEVSAPLTVAFTTGGTASAGLDYVPVGTSVVIPAGGSSTTLLVTPLDDALAEGGETIKLQLVGGVEIGSPAEASVLILDDESDPSLAAAWSFDRIRGALAPDDSRNGHGAQLHPSALAGPRPPLGGARSLAFDEVDDHLTAVDWSYAITGEATLSFWLRASPSTDGGYQYLFSHGSVGAPGSFNVYLSENTGRLRAKLVYQNARVAEILLETRASVMDETWHHAVFSIRADELSVLYLDGVEQAVGHFAGDRLDPTGELFLGARNDLSSTRFFGGELDEVRLYEHALEAVEVRALGRLERARRVTETGPPVKSP